MSEALVAWSYLYPKQAGAFTIWSPSKNVWADALSLVERK